MRILISAAVLFFIWQGLRAQTFELGGQIGYGQTCYADNFSFSELFDDNTENAYSIGLVASYNPKEAFFDITAGLMYHNKANNSSYLNYLRTPVGIDFVFGKRLNFVIGGGLYLSYLFLESGSTTAEFNESKHDFQIGSYIDAGVKYKLNKKLSLFLNMQMDADLSTLYQSPIPQHNGTDYYENIRSYDYQLLVGFKHFISGKQK